MTKKNMKLAILTCVLCLALSSSVYASASYSGVLNNLYPIMQAGDPLSVPPDSPGNRVDPNVAGSPFSGVVSINIRYDGKSFICSGTLVSKRDVVTAGHCVDVDGNGTLIDINAAGNDVRVVFNSSGNLNAVITADQVSMHPDYEGFGNCPLGVSGFCVNDDVAVIHMNADAPDTAKIYSVWDGDIATGQVDTLVGYGASGNGVVGFNVSPSFSIKREGQNVMDLFDLNDEQNFLAGPQEVWYSDFDGKGQDTFCVLFAVCTPQFANDVETALGGGDSGGPSFMFYNGQYILMGNNTFGGTFSGQVAGAFGTYFGGMLLDPYLGYLIAATEGRINVVSTPEPATFALMLAALGLVGAASRRRNNK
jgi:hypothetical protein